MTLEEAISLASSRVDAAFNTAPPLLTYCPHEPYSKQSEFLNLNCREAFYGGAAGGGKSDALLMGALQYVHEPGYAALILRRTFADLSLPGAIMARSQEWLQPTDARWDGQNKTWHFPSGSTITFGYLESANDHYRYQGAEFQYIAFDELTQFAEEQYLYLFSRLRRLQGSSVPLRMRAASNPGGVGHEWVKNRFVLGSSDERVFIPATIRDNPHLDQDEYLESLSNLDPVTLAQLMRGDWDVLPSGGKFERSDFRIIQEPPPLKLWVRYFDLATSVKQKADYTAGALVGVRDSGALVVADVARWKREWPETRDGIKDEQGKVLKPGIIGIAGSDYQFVEALHKKHDLAHRPGYHLGVEAQGMQLALVQDLSRNDQFLRIPFHAVRAKGDKWERASTAAARGRNHGIELVEGPWNSDFINECIAFDGEGLIHDDQVDALSGACEILYRLRGGEVAKDKTIKPNTHQFYAELGRRARR